jgi:transposase
MTQKQKKKRAQNRDVSELERRRIRAVQKVLDGAKQNEVAEKFNVTEGAVSQWMSRFHEKGWDGVKAIPKPGRPVRFAEEYRQVLFEIISKRPHWWGYESDLWTVGMARDVLYEHTGEYFSKTRILSALHELGLSFQKPEVRALEKKTPKSLNG